MSATEIFDRGYRAYDGPRTGIAVGMRAVAVSTIQRALGLRRKFRFKIVPLVVIFIAYIPALAYLGVAVILPAELAGELVPAYVGYFGLIGTMMVLFTAFVVPEVMGSDRSSGMFGLYMASPLNRWHYLASKFGAIIATLSLVTMLPVVFQMVGYSFVGIGPDGVGEIIKTLARIVTSGLVLSIFFGLFGMAASTLTNRHLFASAGIVMLTIATTAFTEVLKEQTDAPEWISMFSVLVIPLELILRIFGENRDFQAIEGVSTPMAFIVWAGVCLAFAAIIGFGYRRMEVTK